MGGDVDPLHRLIGDAAAVREVFERVPALLAGLSGPDHRIAAVNAAYRKLLGLGADIVGRPVRDLLPDTEAAWMVKLLDRVYDTGEPASGREWRVQVGDPAADSELDCYIDFTVLPHRVEGLVVGLVVHGYDVTGRVLDRQDRQIGEADFQRRFHRVRDLVASVQEAMLPAGLPVLPGVDLAGRYLAADSDEAGGGDWYDAVALGGGRVALVVGDVVGHGISAVAVMGQLRAVFADELAAGSDLRAAVRRAQRYAERSPAARAATLCAAILEPVSGALTYITCGHPAPLLVAPGGEARLLATSGGTPLGTDDPVRVIETRLESGEMLLLYTDGLVERPGAPLAEGQADLAAVVADAAADRSVGASGLDSVVHRVCARATAWLTRRGGLGDDITVLAAQRRPSPVGPFEQEMPARAGLLAMLRQRLEGWLRTLGAGSQDLFSVQIAVVEAVTNAVEHAYPAGTSGGVRIQGRLEGNGELVMIVRDRGRWQPVDPVPGVRGRGMVLIQRCMHTVSLDRGEHGTTVTMRRLLSAEPDPGELDDTTRAAAGSPRAQPEFGVRVHHGAAGERVRVVVVGPVDMATAPGLRITLNESGRGGALPLTVDLDGVTHLASSGVQLLADMAGRSAGGRSFRVVASSGSVARHVLALTGMEHLVVDPANG
ncbi:MAG: SpoIIE family protein phosphatase [Pseudonocardia sp.]